jgi:hypothetical protein
MIEEIEFDVDGRVQRSWLGKTRNARAARHAALGFVVLAPDRFVRCLLAARVRWR